MQRNYSKKRKDSDALTIAYKRLDYQNSERRKRAAELTLANIELVFQNKEKEKRAAELIIANRELILQNDEKEKRAVELAFANAELKKAEAYQKKYIKGLEKMIQMISHEVRQPIAHILGLSDLLEKAINSSKKLGTLIVYMKKSAMALDTFTRDLTKFVSTLIRKGKK